MTDSEYIECLRVRIREKEEECAKLKERLDELENARHTHCHLCNQAWVLRTKYNRIGAKRQWVCIDCIIEGKADGLIPPPEG